MKPADDAVINIKDLGMSPFGVIANIAGSILIAKVMFERKIRC